MSFRSCWGHTRLCHSEWHVPRQWDDESKLRQDKDILHQRQKGEADPKRIGQARRVSHGQLLHERKKILSDRGIDRAAHSTASTCEHTCISSLNMSLLPYQTTRLCLQSLALHSRSLPLLASRDLPPFFHHDTPHHYPGGNPKRKKPLRDGVEEEVSDREWELRVGECPGHVPSPVEAVIET
jgi:hypothetical protein